MLKSAGQETICIRAANGVQAPRLDVGRENATEKTLLVASIPGRLR